MLALGFSTAISLLLFWSAYRIGVKQQIQIIHGYHTKNIRKEDIAPYAKRMGLSLFLFGIGSLLSAITVYFTEHPYSYLIFAACALAALVIFIRAQKKYNGSIM